MAASHNDGVPDAPYENAAPAAEQTGAGDDNKSNPSIGPNEAERKPTTAGEFGRWWTDNVGRITITHLHPDLRDVMARARKDQRELTDDEKATVYIEYGNTRTFPHRRERGEVWLGHNAAGFNTYFQPCTIRDLVKGEKPNSKPKKDKIEYVACVWADIDPPAGCADLEAWRRDQVAALENHATLPPPHIVINSGNGVQAIWLLAEPFAINGEQSRLQEFERTTRAIVALFADGDDGTWNADRLLRMPFTTNHPDGKKRGKGRVPCPSGILLWRVDRPRVAIGSLPKQDDQPAARRTTRSASTRSASATVPADLMADLSGKEFALHHQPLLDDLASWDCVLGNRLPDAPDKITLEDGRTFDNVGHHWPAFVDVDLPSYEQLEQISGQGLDALIEGDRTGHWSPSTNNSDEACSFAFSAIKAGIRPAHIAALLTHEQFGISRHCRGAGGHDKIVRAARRCVGQAIALVEAPPVEMRTIDLTKGRLSQALDDAIASLVEQDVMLFERGGELVRPLRLDGDRDGDVKRQKGSLVVEHLTPNAMVSILARHCHFEKYDGNACRLKPTDPTAEFARVLCGDRDRWRFRPLVGITGAPVFRPDGTICATPGYDPATALWLDTDGLDLPAIPDRPTKDDAERALGVLLRPFRRYPIPNPACKSTLAAAQIAPVITPTVDAVPAIGVSAPSPAFGKTKIQRGLGILTTGVDPAGFNQATSDEENDKRLDAALLAGDPVIAIDNVTRPVGGATLCSIVTNPVHKVRVLGRSSLPMVSSRVQLVMNGNNLSFFGDMCRRVLMIQIEDDECEKPETRTFDFDPVAEVQQQRGEMIAAALTILRAWHCADRPVPPGHKPLGSFEGWEPVRLALLWLGEADPVGSQALVYEDDPQREQDRAMLELLWDAKGGFDFKAADLKDRMVAKGRLSDLGSMFLDAPAWNAKRVGGKLRGIAGRWIDGVRLARVKGDPKKGHVYRIERKDGAEWTPPTPDDGGGHF